MYHLIQAGSGWNAGVYCFRMREGQGRKVWGEVRMGYTQLQATESLRGEMRISVLHSGCIKASQLGPLVYQKVCKPRFQQDH